MIILVTKLPYLIGVCTRISVRNKAPLVYASNQLNVICPPCQQRAAEAGSINACLALPLPLCWLDHTLGTGAARALQSTHPLACRCW